MKMGKLHLSYSGQSYSPSHLFINSYGLNPICYSRFSALKTTQNEKNITSSVYDCTVEDVEYHNVSIVTHSHHLVVVITLP